MGIDQHIKERTEKAIGTLEKSYPVQRDKNYLYLCLALQAIEKLRQNEAYPEINKIISRI